MKPVQISSYMSKPIISATKNQTVAYAASLMAQKHVGTIIILEHKKPIGIISERDIINKIVAKQKSLLTPISMVMTRKVILAQSSITDVAAAALMTKHHIKKLPLLKNGRVVGIITQTDLLRILSEKWLL